jgi:hypothetical protein
MKLSKRIILPLFFSPVCFKIYIAAIFQALLHITQRNRMFLHCHILQRAPLKGITIYNASEINLELEISIRKDLFPE